MKKLLSLSLIITVFAFLVSCGPGKARSEMGIEKADTSSFPLEYKNDKAAIEGGTFTIGAVATSPFKGIFSPLHSDDAFDSRIQNLFSENINWMNDDYEVLNVEGGLATFTVDEKNNLLIFKFKEGLKWSDGHPLGVDDLIYTFEVLGHPEYTGSRFDPKEHGLILGMMDYHTGKAKTISGLEKVSDTELRIHVSEISPKVVTGGGTIASVSRLLPKHYLSDVAMKDLETSDKLRLTPLSNGEFVIKSIVPGESIELVPNEHYYLGKSKLEKVILKTLTPQLAVESMKNGEFFSYWSLPSDAYMKYKDLSNFSLIGSTALSYSYIGFNLGRFDENENKNVTDRETPVSDVRVRQAIGYALNVQEMADAFYNGLRYRANGVTPKSFKKYYDETLEGYPYNLEKAKALLAEAGYKDTNGDGIVEKDGKDLVLKLAFMAGSDTQEPLSKAMMQYWEAAGIKTELTTGRLLDVNLFYDKIQVNSDDIDIFVAAWSVGTSLDPASTASRFARLNLSRFTSEKNDKLLEAIADPKGLLDTEYKSNAYKTWQKYWVEEAAVEVPLFFSYSVLPVNKAVKYVSLHTASAKSSYLTEIVSPTPEKAQF